MGVSNKPPEFIKMKPSGKVPVVETPDGPVFESNAIAHYDRGSCKPATSLLKRELGAVNTRLASNTFMACIPCFWLTLLHHANYVGFTQLMIKSFTSEFPHT